MASGSAGTGTPNSATPGTGSAGMKGGGILQPTGSVQQAETNIEYRQDAQFVTDTGKTK